MSSNLASVSVGLSFDSSTLCMHHLGSLHLQDY
uniref:Uncharacterized protein n=1 Tax=Arundo donax TaxID=35708 RepID=A0A0A8YJU5_ARUDO